MPATDTIVVMARFPLPGQTKTRLIPALGATRAADLHAELVRLTLRTVAAAEELRPCRVSIHFAGGDESGMQRLFGSDHIFVPQVAGDLGMRIVAASNDKFRDGAEKVVVIGTDCPALLPTHLIAAFELLDSFDVVIGPALDGGYYLIGMRRCYVELFDDIDWGGELVLQQTMRNARAARLTVSQLQPVSDVDYPEDLIQCRKNAEAFHDVLPTAEPGVLSVIIPTLNEESVLAATMAPLQQLPGVQVIVVDGGSSDRTCEIAASMGATVVRSGRGRGKQMNAGAALARGEVLMFLHADASLPPEFPHAVWETLQDSKAVGGAFRLRVAGRNPLLRLVEYGANFRSRWLQLPYGDQALFVRANTFFHLDGFRNWPLMEDYEFCQRLRAAGSIRQTAAAITVSARRWNQLGIVRTTLINQLCIVGFRLGVCPERLQSFYHRMR